MNKYFYALFFIIIFSTLQAQSQLLDPCAEYRKQNSQLVEDKGFLQSQLDLESLAYDRLQLNLQQEQELRKKYQDLYYKEKRKNDELRQELDALYTKYISLINERDALLSKADSLEREYGRSSRTVEELRIKAGKVTEEMKKIKVGEQEANKAYDVRQKEVDALRSKITRLEDEAKDRISVSEKKIYYEGNWYGYGQEIAFISYKDKSSSEEILEEQNKYTIERLSKLVLKYDLKVKIKLIGESNISDNERDLRIQLAKSRPEDLKLYMINNYHLSINNFSNTDYLKDKARIGVSLRIEKK